MTTVSRPGARRRYRLLNTISILTFAALALAGCSGNGSDSKTMSDAGGGDSAGVLADQPAPAADAEKAAMELQDTSAAAAGSEPTAPLRERAIIANGAVGLEVKDIKSVATKIRGLVSSQGGLAKDWVSARQLPTRTSSQARPRNAFNRWLREGMHRF